MNVKHRRTLKALFTVPIRRDVRFSDIAGVIVALGGEVREGAGSRGVCALRGRRVYLHRPHPGHAAKGYQVEEVREFLCALEIQP
jgi:hypothetical protein